MTVEKLFEACFKEHWSKKQYKDSGHAKEVIGLFKRHFSELKQRDVSTLPAAKIRAWHASMESTPVTANRSLAVLSRLYRFAEEKEWIPQGQNPCKLVKYFKERKRRRYATADEIQKIGAILEREAKRNPESVAFLYVLIFTGARPSSIERATWENLTILDVDGSQYGQLDFSGKSTHSTGEEETLIIPPKAMEMISKLSRFHKKIFSIKMPKGLWARIRKEAGCEDLWARDWRRTFATIGLSNGSGVGVIGELLNHKSTQTTAIYAKCVQDTKMSVAKNISEQLSEMLKGKK